MLLLVPLVIERLSVQEGFRLFMDDAEARINTTLLQLLERDFDVRVPLGDALPEDERGVDVDAVQGVHLDGDCQAHERKLLALPALPGRRRAGRATITALPERVAAFAGLA